MIKISPIIRKSVAMPLYASAVLGLSACVANPNHSETIRRANELSVENVRNDDVNKALSEIGPLIKEESSTAENDFWETFGKVTLVSMVSMGLGKAVGHIVKSKAKKTQEMQKTKHENFRNECLNLVEDYYYNSLYNMQSGGIKLKEKLEQKFKEPYFIRDDAKEDLVKFLDDKSKIFLSDLPMLKYLLDKSTSTSESWAKNYNKYPNYELFVTDHSLYRNHEQACYSLLDSILDYGRGYASKTMLGEYLEQLKKEVFEYGVHDVAAFDRLVTLVDSISVSIRLNLNDAIFASSYLTEFRPNIQAVLGDEVDEEEEMDAPIWQSGPIRKDENRKPPVSNTEISEEYSTEIGFKDIGGQEEAIKQLSRKVLFPLKYPDAFNNQKISHGIVLHGPTGTGKTLLALALANEAGVKFFKMNGLEMLDQYVGNSEKNFRKLFAKAIEQAPSIIFLDEFDSVARKRTGDSQGRHDDKVVNQLLTLLSDIEKEKHNVFVVTATNRLDMLDSAILRNGRIGTHIEVGLPNTPEAIRQILNIHSKGKPLSKTLNTAKIVSELLKKKASGADIAAVVCAALENAYERQGIYAKMAKGTYTQKDLKKLEITDADFEKAIEVLAPKLVKERVPIGFNRV